MKTSTIVTISTVADLDAVEAVMEALDGDGSTGNMPDVTPGHAAVWILRAFNDRGWKIVTSVDGDASEASTPDGSDG